MTATNEEIKAEAERRWVLAGGCLDRAHFIIEVAREGWTPPPPVDPDVLAFREWASKEWPLASEAALSGHMDTTLYADAYLAGAVRMAQAQEQARERKRVEYVDSKAARARKLRNLLKEADQ
jgi:hypothetical protein